MVSSDRHVPSHPRFAKTFKQYWWVPIYYSESSYATISTNHICLSFTAELSFMDGHIPCRFTGQLTTHTLHEMKVTLHWQSQRL